MALDFEKSIPSLSDLNLWFKLSDTSQVSLSDLPEIIRLRWNFFKDNWELIKEDYENLVSSYSNPDKLRNEIEAFTDFMDAQRNSDKEKNPFDSSDILFRFYTIFDNTLISNVTLTAEEIRIFDEKVNRISSFNREDFLVIREQLIAERNIIADKSDGTDEDYNKAYNRSPQKSLISSSTKEVNKMFELQESIKAVDFILANSFALDISIVDPFALARANANNPDIDIETYFSGTLVRMNYGEDLQALAKRTLGDPDKWIDIAITNGLKAPYIDEVGQKLLLISNASGNKINIPSRDDNGELNTDKLNVGQPVFLKSNTQTFPEQRKIVNIKEVPISGELIIELSGESDLDRYKLSDEAHIRIYKQNTTNSSFYILIPNTNILDDDAKSSTPWFLQGSDVVEKRQKIDLELADDGDIIFNSSSDVQISYGLQNAIQAVRLKMIVEAGELRRHADYGLKQLTGTTNADINDIKSQLIQSITENIDADERFSRIDRLDIEYSNTLSATNPVALNIIMVVVLAGSNQLVPISFSINI
jgi:Pyruvate/2-oxoacid:ferredoxin oxidoreductase gamma subunit